MAVMLPRLLGAVVGLMLFAAYASVVRAGTITSFGSVTPLDDTGDVSLPVIGTADWNLCGVACNVPLTTYQSDGMTIHVGDFSTILPGVVSSGFADPTAASASFASSFPNPIGGGGSYAFQSNVFGSVVTFSEPVTQFGLTFSNNGNQYITAWSASGALIGQVNWSPTSDAAFVGIDTLGVLIAMLAVGNDDLFNGQTYGAAGHTTITDDWIWAGETAAIPLPAAFPLFATALAGMGLLGWRRKRKASASV